MKTILDGSSGTYRAVTYNSTGTQVAVITGTLPGLYPKEAKYKDFYKTLFARDVSYFTKVEWKVSIPIEGMGGWGITCNSRSRAFQIATNERSKRGKVLNRLFHLPAALIAGNLL